MRALAERDVLLELLGIFAHDLNNPLQTLVVLCELALDDSAGDDEARLRAEQCLTAADRLRAIAHSMTSLFRGRRVTIRQLCDLMGVLVSRRFDRYGIGLFVDIDEIADLSMAPRLDLAYAAICLAAISAANAQGTRRSHLVIEGRRTQGGRAAIAVVLELPGSPPQVCEFPTEALARVRALASDDLRVGTDGPRLILDFNADA